MNNNPIPISALDQIVRMTEEINGLRAENERLDSDLEESGLAVFEASRTITAEREAHAETKAELGTDLAEKQELLDATAHHLLAAEHEIAVLNHISKRGGGRRNICDAVECSGIECDSPECLVLLREVAEKELTEQEGASNV